MVLDEVDRLTGVEQVGRAGVPKAMDVPSVRRKIGGDRVAGEESLDLALPQAALATDEESAVVVGARS